ncbi:hypothetical protein AAG906_039520 [Vitis piasezkii]
MESGVAQTPATAAAAATVTAAATATATTVATKNPDKSKRDEWSEGGVTSLLDVYESKWLLRNRAKLKGTDWEDIAQQVSIRDSGMKALKTPNQCKNKIESMKKRYRIESSVNGPGSSWQFYGRMDGLLKGTSVQNRGGDVGFGNGVAEDAPVAAPKVVVDDSENDPRRVYAQVVEKGRNCETADLQGENHIQGSHQNNGSNTVGDDSEFSAPKSKIGNVGDGSRKVNPFKRRKGLGSEVAESIRLLAHSMLKIEQARMEMYKDSERLRVEAEVRRAEMELKRTEIIAKTQLQIARLFVKRQRKEDGKSGTSALIAEPMVSVETEEKNG